MKRTSQMNRQTETFPSQINPEINPEIEDLEIDPEDIPKSIEIALTNNEISLLNKLIRKQRNSPIWITEINRIRLLLQSIAHQVKTAHKLRNNNKSILDPEPKNIRTRRLVEKGFTFESPFV